MSLDLSAKRLADLHKSGIDVVELLGESFQSIIQFYDHIEQGLLPRTLDALAGTSPLVFMTLIGLGSCTRCMGSVREAINSS